MRPVTSQDVDADSQVRPPGAAVTVYFVIAAPPSEAGADQDTVTCPSPAETDVIAGAPGTVAGITESEVAEVAPTPIAFVAVTVNVYGVPLLRPVTAHDIVADSHVRPPGAAVTMYFVTADPRSSAGDHETVT